MGDRVAVLRRGVLQQFDAPQTLYERPANLFVASFIGSPAMNVVEGTFDGASLRIGSSTLELPAHVVSARPGLAGYAGKTLAVGIRPEALDEAARRNGDTGRLRGVVSAIEALGPEQLAYVDVPAKPVLVDDVVEGLVDTDELDDLAELKPDADGNRATLVARLDASTRVRPDEPVELAIDLGKLHFFDLASGATI